MAQPTSPAHALIQHLENKRYEAVLTQDFDTLESLCHTELVYGHTGETATPWIPTLPSSEPAPSNTTASTTPSRTLSWSETQPWS